MTVQTIPYFYEEICRFRKLMGEKSFWAKSPEQRELAIRGLGYVFLTLTKEDGSALDKKENEETALTFETTMQEYYMRERIILFGSINLDSPTE